jgi:hypothetical protein
VARSEPGGSEWLLVLGQRVALGVVLGRSVGRHTRASDGAPELQRSTTRARDLGAGLLRLDPVEDVATAALVAAEGERNIVKISSSSRGEASSGTISAGTPW